MWIRARARSLAQLGDTSVCLFVGLEDAHSTAQIDCVVAIWLTSAKLTRPPLGGPALGARRDSLSSLCARQVSARRPQRLASSAIKDQHWGFSFRWPRPAHRERFLQPTELSIRLARVAAAAADTSDTDRSPTGVFGLWALFVCLVSLVSSVPSVGLAGSHRSPAALLSRLVWLPACAKSR